MAKETTTIGKIYSTTNYDMFKTILGNRPIKRKGTHYYELRQSMQDDGQIVPAVVNEKHEIIDGQHRLEVCKELGIPFIYIIIDGTSFRDIAKANEGKKWSTEMFVNGYALNGGENTEGYRYLTALYDEFSPPVIKSVFTRLLGTASGHHGLRVIREGRFTTSTYEYDMLANCLRELIALGYADFIKENKRSSTTYWETMCYVWRHPGVNNERMIKLMWQNEKRIPATSKVREYLEVLTKIYNKGLDKNKRIYLDKDYDQGLYRKW